MSANVLTTQPLAARPADLIARLRAGVASARLRGKNCSPYLTSDDVAGIADILESAAELVWIPIVEMHPPSDKSVLLASKAFVPSHDQSPGWWHTWVHMARVVDQLPTDTVVTHWMPLPEAPKGALE